jgi:hypothetical protein
MIMTDIACMIRIHDILSIPGIVTLFQMVKVQIKEISPPELIIFAAMH